MTQRIGKQSLTSGLLLSEGTMACCLLLRSREGHDAEIQTQWPENEKVGKCPLVLRWLRGLQIAEDRLVIRAILKQSLNDPKLKKPHPVGLLSTLMFFFVHFFA